MHFLHFLKFYRQTKIKMKDEITEFFGNLENITDFLITKWIYEQTNDLKPYLFCQLNKAFNRYCVDWLENKRNNQTKYDFPQVYNGQIRDFLTTPGLFETSIIADSAIKKDIVLNHYSFYENIIEFESQPQPMKGLFSVWDSVLYSEVYRFQNIMHKLFEEIKSKEPTAQTQEPEAVNPDELLSNPEITIFKNDFSYTLFTAMKEIYKGTATPQADYSFLFDIMQKDNFVICTGIKFIDYLIKFDISLTKIDSSKTGNGKKTKVYNAIKESFQKKHGLSTV